MLKKIFQKIAFNNLILHYILYSQMRHKTPLSVPSQLLYVRICGTINRFIYEEILDRKKRL